MTDIVRLRGIGVSPGIGMGEVSLQRRIVFSARKQTVPAGQVEQELERLRRAIERTRSELVVIKEKVREGLGEVNAFIFDAHLLILKDPSLVAGLEEAILGQKVRSEWALSEANARYNQIFESISDEYFRQRKSDISDVLTRVYRNLEGREEKVLSPDRQHILVAHELLPSEAALRLNRKTTLGIALDVGGQTSHTAILARSLEIPAVLGLRSITTWVREGDFVIVDGTDGEIIINPPPAVKREFQAKKDKYENYRLELRKTAKLKAVTLDQVRFKPLANIELPEEAKLAKALGAEGVGLFRSEFIYLQRSSLPSEDDHLEAYSRIARDAAPYPVYIRTLDIGGEKNLPRLNIEKEANPALGLRAVRFSLKNRPLFRTQLRAILRASARKNVRILVPMVTEVEEVVEVKNIFEEVKDELRSSNEKFDLNIPLGVMIEVPAAAALADVFLKEVDFISIGTNDLIQYFLAVDRSNEFVSYLYRPLHPGVLRLIRSVIQAGTRAGKEVAVCGEMAADPLSALILLGFGLRTFSMNPIFIPRVKKALRSVDAKFAETVAEEALKLKSARAVEEYVIEEVLIRYPKVLLTGQPSGK